MNIRKTGLGVALLLIAACSDPSQTALQPPQPVSDDRIGHYCNMIVVNHTGPKGQVILMDRRDAYWFTSVRDTLAFTLLPEEPKNIHAIYVTAMDDSEWDHPENDSANWILANNAWYVIGSEKRGGMGQLEAIPFRDKSLAEAFAQKHGGRAIAYAEIPSEYILGSSSSE